ncbi:Histidine triad nucleotide-binding protein 3 [Carex littledalei]|uniref:Histidine triad nucleotide-binding protein 3 n=1 Tax=Carex littledalei TaxID=544730 RepID=A0A833VE70_9POAL|nr:Histidine triad nucleotide-binding protein 3 [Carex littledalei]
MSFCFGVSRARKSKSAKHTMDGQDSTDYCIFCDIARGATSTSILFSDEKVVAFPDINPSAFRHYLVIPVEHVPTVNSLEKKPEHYELVNHMLKVGEELLNRDAPNSVEHRFGFHQPPFNSINHLHLHCLALPFTPAWKQVKYTPLGRLGFIGANKVLEKLNPRPTLPS